MALTSFMQYLIKKFGIFFHFPSPIKIFSPLILAKELEMVKGVAFDKPKTGKI